MVFMKGKIDSGTDAKLYGSLGSLIKDYRNWSELSQEKFSELIGVSIRELRNWETDRHRARFDNLHDISEVAGIPMQVCVALNADQPLWYSLQKRRFSYSTTEEAHISLDELSKYREQLDDGALTRYEPITTDKHINTILSWHQDFYGIVRPLERNVVKTASMILPDMNRIAFDCWGHYVGHFVCLPIKTDVYQQIKKRKGFEGYLTSENIIDITTLHGGVFLFYLCFAVHPSIAYPMVINSVRHLARVEQKERYIVAIYTASIEGREFFGNLGMRIAFKNLKNYDRMYSEIPPTMYEMELNRLMRPFGPFGAMGWMIEEYDRKARPKNLTRSAKQEERPAIPTQEPNNITFLPKYFKGKLSDCKAIVADHYQIRNEACSNPECTLYGKSRKGNIISNGTYRTKEGPSSHRFLCKECGKSFCSRTGSLFYDLRSPEEKVLMALKLLVKGMPLRSVAQVLEVKLNTVRYWLKVASEQSGKIDVVLMKKLKVSEVELEALWTFVKKNALRQRAALWKTRNTSHETVGGP